MADAPTDGDSSRRRPGLWSRLARVLGRERIDSADAVAEALRESESSGELIEGAQKDMILRAARFDRLVVADVMRPRAEIVAIEASASLGEAARAFSDSQHSRLPMARRARNSPIIC
jgi:CBS domain containing-hemolysin-like protein